MNKKVVVGGIALTMALATLGTTVVFAQGPWGPGDGGRLGSQGSPPFPGGFGWGVYPSSNRDQIIVDALGISVDEFLAAREEGKTLADLADELNVDLASIREAVEEARAQALSEAVEAGRISSEQAEWMADHGAMGIGPGHGTGMGHFGGECFFDQ